MVDCNNFYASCEQVFRPDLRDRPVVVLSNNDGCIVSRSTEARAAGIPMGEPEFKARALLRARRAAVFSSNYALYGDMSGRVMRILEDLSPLVEPYSIDEAFLRLDGDEEEATATARRLGQRILRWTGLPVSIGLAATKTLAKLANHAAKRGDGVFCLPSAPQERNSAADAFLASFPAAEVWGVGRRVAPKLASRGIRSALDLKNADDLWIRRHFGVTLWRTALELRGLPCLDEATSPAPRHTVLYSRSFGCKVTNRETLRQAVVTFTSRAGEKLRRAGLLASMLAVHIRTARHNAGLYRSEAAEIRLPFPTADSAVLIKAALRGLDRLYKSGYAYARAGVMLSELERRDHLQGSLLGLDQTRREHERERLMQTLDAINLRYGRSAVRYAAEGPKRADWHMRRQFLSPAFTTRWDELAVARCG